MKTIVWDLDDVLNTFTESWLTQAWKVEHPTCRVGFQSLHSNPPLDELHTTLDEYTASLDRYRVSSAASALLPDPIVLDWFRQEGAHFHHHVLTARPTSTVGPAASWVFQHFGSWIRHFHFVPSFRLTDEPRSYAATKAELLPSLGTVDFFIDDSPVNVAGASRLGIKSYLFPQPWNDAEVSIAAILSDLSTSLRQPVSS